MDGGEEGRAIDDDCLVDWETGAPICLDRRSRSFGGKQEVRLLWGVQLLIPRRNWTYRPGLQDGLVLDNHV